MSSSSAYKNVCKDYSSLTHVVVILVSRSGAKYVEQFSICPVCELHSSREHVESEVQHRGEKD